jgi:hypothetical protein
MDRVALNNPRHPEPAEQVELAGIPFDVTQSSDGVLTAFNPEEQI